jgi:ATP-binding cassette, subfamily C, bacterial LapB
VIDLISHLTVRPLRLTLLLVTTLLANLLALAPPIFVIQVLNRYVAYGVDSTLATLATGAGFAIFLEFGFRVIRLRLAASVAAEANRSLSIETFDTLATAAIEHMDAIPAKVRQAVTESVGVVRSVRSATSIAIILDLPFSLLFIGVLALLSPVLAVIALVAVVLALGFGVFSYRNLRGATGEYAEKRAACGTIISAVNSDPDTIRLFGGGNFLRRRWLSETWGRDYLDFVLVQREGGIQTALAALAGILSIVIISVGAILVVQGELDVGILIAANILAARALGPVVRMARLSEVFAKARHARALITQFQTLKPSPTGMMQPKAVNGRLDISGLTYLYLGRSNPVFEGLNCSIQPGQMAVVTGSNGAGKTTLARLVTGLLTPTRGDVLIDGVALTQISPDWWRKNLVYLPQEPRFLPGSIRDNLLAFNENLNQEIINALIDKSGLQRFIDRSSTGLDTLLTPQSDHLPVGIRRRLALARALASNGRFVVMDEPTEAMDAEGRATVLGLISALKQANRTVICFSIDAQVVGLGDVLVDLNSKPAPRVMTAKDVQNNLVQNIAATLAETNPAHAPATPAQPPDQADKGDDP